MRTGLICLISSILFACGSEGTSPSDSVDTTDPSKFCRASATTVCEKLFGCLTKKERDDRGIEATIPECERSFESGCEDSVDDCIDAEHGYASTPAGSCLNEMDAATCRDAGDPWFDAPSCKKICERTAGRFKMKWRFEPFHVCSELRVSTVSLITRLSTKQFVDTFRCDDGGGTTELLPVGKYTIRVEMHDAAGTRVWATDRAGDDIDASFVDLGELVIPVSPQ